MERYTQEELRAADYEQDAAEVTAAQLGENIAEDMTDAAQQAQEERESQMEAIREGIGELFEDGWTAQELAAFSRSPLAQEMIAKGAGVARAACAYLRAKGMAGKKRGVPTARAIAADGGVQANPIETMTDEEFDAFSRKARHAMMSGKKVRI